MINWTDDLYNEVCNLLRDKSEAWWYHKELRQQGNHEEADRLVNRSVNDNIDTLEGAVFCQITPAGWSIHYINERGDQGTLSSTGGDVNDATVQCCLLCDIPVYDCCDCSVSELIGGPYGQGHHARHDYVASIGIEL